MFIDVRCQYCSKLLCKVSKDFFGLVQIKCQYQKCRRVNTVSLAIILKQMEDKTVVQFPARTSAR